MAVQGASSGPSVAASATLGSLGPRQSDTYTITVGNPTAGPLDDLTMREVVPRQLSMGRRIGQANVTGTGTAPQVESRLMFKPVSPTRRDEASGLSPRTSASVE